MLNPTPTDTPFARRARLQQSKWREAKGYPIGISQGGNVMGNYIERGFAWRHRVNLLTEDIRRVALEEIANSKASGALIQQRRLWENMLSSQPLCFNLFGVMRYDLGLATAFFRESFPQREIGKVTNVRFEYSPSRGEKALTGDHSAFDVFVEYETSAGARGFIGIEVKYAETLTEGRGSIARTYAHHRANYLRVASRTSPPIFDMERIDDMARAPKFQIWRDHLLALSMLQANLYEEGFFLFLYPYENANCRKGFQRYWEALGGGGSLADGESARDSFSDSTSGSLSDCESASLEDLSKRYCLYEADIFQYIHRLHKMVNQPWSQELVERYTWPRDTDCG